LHYAAQDPLPDGGRRIVLATDRPIRFWEAWHQSRTLDYPFTVIELRMDSDGTGEGKLALASRWADASFWRTGRCRRSSSIR
jgi:hypothetical protein